MDRVLQPRGLLVWRRSGLRVFRLNPPVAPDGRDIDWCDALHTMRENCERSPNTTIWRWQERDVITAVDASFVERHGMLAVGVGCEIHLLEADFEFDAKENDDPQEGAFMFRRVALLHQHLLEVKQVIVREGAVYSLDEKGTVCVWELRRTRSRTVEPRLLQQLKVCDPSEESVFPLPRNTYQRLQMVVSADQCRLTTCLLKVNGREIVVKHFNISTGEMIGSPKILSALCKPKLFVQKRKEDKDKDTGLEENSRAKMTETPLQLWSQFTDRRAVQVARSGRFLLANMITHFSPSVRSVCVFNVCFVANLINSEVFMPSLDLVQKVYWTDDLLINAVAETCPLFSTPQGLVPADYVRRAWQRLHGFPDL